MVRGAAMDKPDSERSGDLRREEDRKPCVISIKEDSTVKVMCITAERAISGSSN
jgi:hypothetical protein